MKKNLIWYILIASIVLLLLVITNLLNINYIKQENTHVEISGEKVLVLKNDYGGLMKVDGTSFKYNNNMYFKSNYNLSQNNEVYFVNIKNGILLIEELKSIIFPFKIYNMINPQETRFSEIIEIYKNKGVANEK